MPKALIAILTVVFGGALVVYNWSGATPLIFQSTRGAINVAPPAPVEKGADKPAVPKTQHHKPAGAGEPRLPSVTALPQSPMVSTPPNIVAKAICCPHPDLPFPTPETLRRGSTSKEIRATFGQPSLSVAGTNGGHIREKYYYVNADRNRLTLVYLDNGRLMSAESLSAPYFELPGSSEAEDTEHTAPH